MESLRWILIIAGVAILVALWLSGRSGRRDTDASLAPDPLLGDDPLGDGFGDFGDVDPDDFVRPGAPAGTSAGPASGGGRRGGVSPLAPAAAAFDDGTAGPDGFGPADGPVVRGGHGGGTSGSGAPARDAFPQTSTAASVAAQGFGGWTAKFEAIGEKLAPNRRRRPVEPDDEESLPSRPRPYASKIVMLHVVAPDDEILPPEALRDMFERRGYHHGDMGIYHSLYEGRTVFSVARMIKPGTFDIDDLSTFETPGLALILQLPGPVAADTAFEVMLEEAFGMADELGGGIVLDGDRSTLGRQTEQHLRESIHEYMHRQKYFDSVA